MDRGRRRGLAAGAAVLALAALGVGLLAGCGSDTASGGQVIKLSPEPKGSTSVTVKVGDTVVLSFAANATTGYEWQFAAGDTFTIEKSEYVPDPNPDGLAGSGGAQVVTLKVTEAGTSDFTGVYVRPWETPSPSPEAETTVTIVSE